MTQTFSDPEAVSRYAEGPRRMVPGYDSLLVMTDVLLAEVVPAQGHILILGAGGGLEMAHFAGNHAEWHFTGVDPSAEMLALAAQTMGPMSDRADLICGYIDDAPPGPFDAAVCQLTLHFIPKDQRLATLTALRRRLKPGASFICAHYSVPGDGAARALWFARFAGFATASGIPADRAQANANKIAAALPILTPAEDEDLLRQAGFAKVQMFYTGFTFRGWVCQVA